uniref:NIN1 (RPN12) binding protein 1 homolog n=1 Tax=Sander lucioperca TaxID=283035 RepID=A0A8C9Y542_SANLU
MWWTRSGTNPPEESGLLPYTLNFKEPHPEHIRTGDRVSKKTGDYPSLSATDIKVLALTYQLELEHVGYQHLKKEPEIKVPQGETSGIYTHARTHGGDVRRRGRVNSFQFWREPLPSIDSELLDLLVSDHSDDEDKENEPEDEEEEDGGGNYILRCHAALSETTSNMSKVFCPHCGNKTLKKLAVTVTEDGPTHTHTHTLTNSSLWAFQHSLPLPRGGKHSNNPQLVEDQSFPQQRLSRKARQKTDNDIYSRAANLQIRDGQSGGGRRRTNPNATHKKFVKKK